MKFTAVLLFITYCLCQVTIDSNPSAYSLILNDNNVLEFALFVENFDTNYYALHLDPSVNANAFTSNDFTAAGYTAGDYALFLTLLSNERAHVAYLASILQSRGVAVPGACTYNYPATSGVRDFVFYSKLFENVGTAAYDGAINAIYDKTLQQGAATIATVEARHAAFLNTLATFIPANAPALVGGLNVSYPFPNVLDVALPPTTIVGLVRPFINQCPYSIDFNPAVNTIVPVNIPGALPNPSQQQVNANDIATANFALSLEILEAVFYNTYYPTLNVASFTSVGFTATQYAYFDVVRAHENMHVTILQQAILAAGGTPVTNCTTYTFPVTAGNAQQFVTVSALLENTGVMAYDGAVNTINNPSLRQSAATIATVEARHAAIISQITNFSNPYSAPADTPLAPSQIVANVNSLGLVDSACPSFNNPALLPQVIQIYPYNNNTTPAPPAPSVTPAPVGTTVASTTSSASVTAALCLLNVAVALVALF